MSLAKACPGGDRGRLFRFLALFTGLLTAVFLLAACTSSSGSPSASSSSSGSGAAKDLKAVSDAVAKQPSYAFKLTATSDAEQVDATGQATTGDSSTLKATVTVGGVAVDVRIIGNTAYAEVPETYRSITPKSWVSVDLTTAPTNVGIPGVSGLVTALPNLDPGRQVRALSAAGSVTSTREGTLTHYAAQVPVAALLSSTAAGQRSALQKQLETANVKSGQVDLWVGADHLPTKTTWKLGSASGTVDYTQWGAPVTVEKPPASDTTTLAEILGSFAN